MVECPSCGRPYQPGALFCSQCGFMLSGDSMHTKPIGEPAKPTPGAEPRTPGADLAGEGLPGAMAILIKSTARQVFLTGDGECLVGRQDPGREIFPNIDLTPDGGLDGGVSRRHARIYKQRNQFFVEDLGSANGTFLNGQRLTPYLPYPLRDEDEVQLGLIRLQIQLSQV